MHKALLIVSLLALSAAAVVLWQPWATARPAGPLPASGPSERPGEPGVQETKIASDDRDARGTALADRSPQRVERDLVEATGTAAGGPLLRVVDGSSDDGVAGAEVRFFQEHDLTEAERASVMQSQRDPQLAALLERFGRLFHADRRGELHLPPLTGRGLIGGKSGELGGILVVQGGEEPPLVLRLFPLRVVELAVHDAVGRTVSGIPVAVVTQVSGRWRPVWHGETAGPAATARADGIGQLVRVHGGGGGETIAVVDLPLPERPRVAFDPDDPPRSPLVLVLPPTGRVEVELEHADPGRLVDARVRLANLDAQDAAQGQATERVATAGRAVFEHVGLGLTLSVQGVMKSGNTAAECEVQGPTAAGEIVFVRLPMTGVKPILVARLRDASGELLCSQGLDALLLAEREGSSWSSSFNLQSDADGRIHIELADDLGAGTERILKLSQGSPLTRAVQLTLPVVLKPGENDVGDLTLAPPPLLCGGIVQNGQGEPVSDAEVEVEQKKVYDQSRPDGFYWTSADVPAATTGADGRFAIHGLPRGHEFAMSIRCAGYLPVQNEPFATGAAELRFVLDEAGGLAGRVLVGEASLRRRLAVKVADRADAEKTTEPDADGGFRFESLVPGIYRASVMLFGQVQPALVVDGVVVRSGEVTEDPRLQDVDLTGEVRLVSFRVLDPDGKPARDGAAIVLAGSAPQKHYGAVFLEHGRGEILATKAPLDLFVFAEGARSVRATDVQDGQEIVLPPAFAVRLRLPAGVEAAADSLTLEASLRQLDSSFDRQSGFELRGQSRTSTMNGSLPWSNQLKGVLVDGFVLLRVGEPGRYRVQWTLHQKSGGLSKSASVPPDGEPQVLDVTDRSGEQVFDAALAAEQLKAARARL